jgi:hypothetical protein
MLEGRKISIWKGSLAQLLVVVMVATVCFILFLISSAVDGSSRTANAGVETVRCPEGNGAEEKAVENGG